MSEKKNIIKFNLKNKSKKDKVKKIKKKGKVKKILKWTFLSLFLLFFIACIILFIKLRPIYKEAKEKMYDVMSTMDSGTFKRKAHTLVYDSNGELIGKIGAEHYKYLKIADISDYIQNGYISVEDKTFKTHHGVDYKAILRAGIAYIKNKGKITQGGSTITQQVVKNNLLSNEQSFRRKLVEAMIAKQIEKKYSKADIMEFYCNTNYYGNGCYGVEGASKYYFGKSSKKLTLGEATMIVGISQSPNEYNPVIDYKKCISRRNRVLKYMLNDEMISKDEYNIAKKEKPTIVEKSENISADNDTISYSLYCSALKLMELDDFEFKYVFKSEKEYKKYKKEYNTTYSEKLNEIKSGGYQIYTSIVPNIQKKLQKQIDTVLKSETYKQDDGRFEIQGAAVCIDNKSGNVVAIVGKRSNKNDFYNRAFQSTRQTGSAIKPLIDYGPAINEGHILPGSIAEDKEINIKGYKPKNAWKSYLGKMTIREAVERSVNTIATQIFDDVGSQKALSYLGKLKFNTLTFGDSYNTAVSLGGFTKGVTVSDMTRGYATIANYGQMRDNTSILKIESEEDGVIYEYDSNDTKEVFNEDTSFMLIDIMQGVFKSEVGTAHNINDESQVYAGKTGTTDDDKDTYMCGFSKYYTTCVWVGNDVPQKGGIKGGSNYTKNIWQNFMKEIHKNKKKEEFTAPKTVKLINNTTKEEKSVHYTTNVWASRPKDFDYTSDILKHKKEQRDLEKRLKKQKKDAEKAVQEFESYVIENTSELKLINEWYQQTLDIVNKIEDKSSREVFLERCESKYARFQDEIISKWSKVLEEEEKEAEVKRIEKNSKNEQKSLLESEVAIKRIKIETAELYISILNNAKIRTTSLTSLISYADEAVENCSEYNEYTSLSRSLQSAKSSIEKLETETEYNTRKENERRSAEEAKRKAEEQIRRTRETENRILN